MVSVLGWIVTVLHADGLLGYSHVYQASAGIFPAPSLQASGATAGLGVGTFGGSTYPTGP